MATDRTSDAVTRRQFYIERYANGMSKRIRKATLETSSIARIIESDSLSQTQKVAQVRKEYARLKKKGTGILVKELSALWKEELKWMKTWLPDEVNIPDVSISSMIRKAVNKPMVDAKGMSAQQLYDRVWDSAAEQTRSLALSAVYYDMAADEVRSQLRAIEAQFQRGLLASARTSTFAMANETRDQMYKANKDLVEGVVFTAVLDGRTTIFCLNIDGTIVDLDDPRRPPFHVNCRTIALPVFEGESRSDVNEVLENRVQVKAGDDYQKGENDSRTTRANIRDGKVKVVQSKAGKSGSDFMATQRHTKQGRQFIKDSLGVERGTKFIKDLNNGKSPKVSMTAVFKDQQAGRLDIEGLRQRRNV